MRNLMAFLLVTLALSSPAAAVSVALTADPSSSLVVSLVGGSGFPATTGVTGTQTVDIDLVNGTIAATAGGRLELDDFIYGFGPAPSLQLQGIDWSGAIAGEPSGIGPGGAVDAGGFVWTIDAGTYVFPSVPPTQYDMAVWNAVMTLATPTASSLVLTPLGGGAFDVVWTLPVAVHGGQWQPTSNTITFDGTLVLRGQVVPEPGTAVLLLAGVLPLARRARRRR